MEAGRRASLVRRMVGFDMSRRWRRSAKLALALAGATLAVSAQAGRTEQMKESVVQDDIRNPGAKPFYFGRILFSISAPDPVVDWDAAMGYAELAELPRFYLGRVDDGKRLIWLETWRRHPLPLPAGITIGGRPLLEQEVPVRLQGNRIISQTPAFFMQQADGNWQRVPVEATQGETRFIRLRWLAALEPDEPASLAAEYLEQRPESVEAYVYDREGRLAEVYRQDEAGVMQRLR